MADPIIGDDGDNELVGTDGNDQIFGLGGNDALDGRLGDDLLDGGGPARISPITDPLQGRWSLTSGAGTASGADGNDTLVTHRMDIHGRPSTIQLTGDGGYNFIGGGGGNDTIDGAGGDDGLFGGDGNDRASWRRRQRRARG